MKWIGGNMITNW